MNPALRNKLIAASAGGTLAIAAALGAWYEGEGPTEVIGGVTYNVSYVDAVGVWTVCRGLTGPVAGPGKKYPAARCREMEEERLAAFEVDVRRLIISYDMYNQWRQAALVDFAYNAGTGNLASSTMRVKFNSGDDVGGCRELARWVKGRVKGILTTLKGLVLRRADEMDLCMNWSTP